MTKPSIPQGTRDFSSSILKKRNFILSTIKKVFEVYGFEPLETPAMENLDTLMGKYGEEGDKLIFKILNNGLNDPKNIDKAKTGFDKLLAGKNTPELTERALKYDLTIPFARYVAMNHNTLVFPYKRYQIQPVWRADRPQKGRYREFTQCDADVVGSDNLLNEVELCLIYHEVFTKLGLLNYQLCINNRKILTALAIKCGGVENITNIAVAIDKMDKIGLEKVKVELAEKGLTEQQVGVVEKYLTIGGGNEEKFVQLQNIIGDEELALQGMAEIRYVYEKAAAFGVKCNVELTLARGLNYYTGIIYEVKAPAEVKIGSIGGGGRYNDLTGLFGVPNIPGVGISFGVDRIYDVMEELNLFPDTLQSGPTAIFFNMGDKESNFAFQVMQQLRKNGISCELFLEPVKISKQFSYAERKKIPYAIIIGNQEIEQQYCQIKNLDTSQQQMVALNKIVEFFNNN
jgi:histidyl-tRNA synthetase